jgi:hypothetical protein
MSTTPVITGISPVGGSAAGGDAVTITGTGAVDITATTPAGTSAVGQADKFTDVPGRRKVWYVASWAIAAFAGSMAVALLQWAQAFGGGTVFVGLALLTLIGGGSYGAFSALIGTDGRTSTSKTQAGLWTVVLAWGIAFLLGRHLFEHFTWSAQPPGR